MNSRRNADEEGYVKDMKFLVHWNHNTLAGETKVKPEDAKLCIFTFIIVFATGILLLYFTLI